MTKALTTRSTSKWVTTTPTDRPSRKVYREEQGLNYKTRRRQTDKGGKEVVVGRCLVPHGDESKQRYQGTHHQHYTQQRTVGGWDRVRVG